MVFGVVWADLLRDDPIANVTIELIMVVQRSDPDIADGIEQLLGFEITVVVTDARMIPADNEVGAAVVLPDDRIEDGLPWPGVSHSGFEHR